MQNTWKETSKYSNEFEIRIENMISLLNLDKINSIMDLGCGLQTLKKKLTNNIKYIGIDVYKHVDSTIQIDFNKGEFYDENVDIIFCSGIFEHIYDIEKFSNNISKNTNIILGSYIFYNDFPKHIPLGASSYNMSEFLMIWHKL